MNSPTRLPTRKCLSARRVVVSAGLGMVLLWVGGCAEADDQPDEQVAELEAQLQQKSEDLRKARERYDQQLTDFTVSVRQRHAREVQELEARLTEEAESYTRTIRSLQTRLDEAEKALAARAAAVADETEAPAPDQAVYPPLPRIVTRTATPAISEFAVTVKEVFGERAVLGSHSSTRMVETEEEYRDTFGEVKKRMRPEPYEITEYGYQASAVVGNTAEQPVSVSLRCGQGEKLVELAPGEQRTVTIDAARGAPLVVRVNGRIRSFPVTYR